MALLLSLVAGCAGRAPAASPSAHKRWVLQDAVLTIADATDIRWRGPGMLAISSAEKGLAVISVENPAAVAWLAGWPESTGPGSRYMHLGWSVQVVASADIAFGVRWRSVGGGATLRQFDVEYVGDLDVWQDRIVLTGLRRDADGRVGADGALAWVGTLSEEAVDLRPVLPFADMDVAQNCAGFPLPVVRFLNDGSFVVVPGSEEGVYVFDSDGGLRGKWDSALFGLAADCAFSPEERTLLATSPTARQQWVNRRDVIDDVVQLGADVALLVRRAPSENRVRWRFQFLNGSVIDLPFTSESPGAHASADVRGNQVAFLISSPPRSGEAARLVLMELEAS